MRFNRRLRSRGRRSLSVSPAPHRHLAHWHFGGLEGPTDAGPCDHHAHTARRSAVRCGVRAYVGSPHATG